VSSYRFAPDLAEMAAMLEGPLVDWGDPAAIAESRSGAGLAALAPAPEPREDVTISEFAVAGDPRLAGSSSSDASSEASGVAPGDASGDEPDDTAGGAPGHTADHTAGGSENPAAGMAAALGEGTLSDKVTIRLYRPSETAPVGGLLYIHGGGFMTGSLDLTDAGCQAICSDIGLVVASVDYRLAPEDPYPAGLQDCYAALCWFADNAESLGFAADRIAVGGASAGGGLSAGLALLARDLGGPALCYQVLQIPELDDRLDTPSMRAFTDTPVWSRPSAVWSWRHYLGDLCGGDVPAYAAPARCDDLAGLPPAFVTTMEYDPLRDEGIVYALGLLQAGVSVELHQLPGTFHGSSLVPAAAMSRLEHELTIEALRRAFATPQG